MAHSVLLLAEEPGISLQVLFCLEQMGARVFVMAGPRAGHLRGAAACRGLKTVDLTADGDWEAAAAAIDGYAAETGSQIVVPSGMPSMRALIATKPYLKTPTLPLPERQLFNTLDDKFTFGELLQDLGVAAPKSVFIGRPAQLSISLLEREIGYPMVIKPTNQGNANGVVVCHDRLSVIRNVIENRNYPYDSLIAQEFIPGYDIDLSVLAHNGEVLAWAVQRRRGKAIHFRDHADYVAVGRHIVAATGYSGPAHFDARYDHRDGRIKLVECNPRFWASITASLYCGVNFVAEGIAQALGERAAGEVCVPPSVFVPPTAMIAALIASPWRRTLWSRSNFAALWQVFQNLPPYLAEEWNARSRQITEMQRRSGDSLLAQSWRFGKG